MVKTLTLALTLGLLWWGSALGFGPNMDTGLEKADPQNLILYVIQFADEDRRLGLSETLISKRVTDALKRYGIRVTQPGESETFATLYVRITTLDAKVYSVEVGFFRGVMFMDMDMAFETLGTVWSTAGLGTLKPTESSDNLEQMLYHLDLKVDVFVKDYLKVNKERMGYTMQ